MKRHRVWILLLLITFGMTACKKEADVNSTDLEATVALTPTEEPTIAPTITIEKPINRDYRVVNQTINLEDRITGNYPQINGLIESDKEAKINQLITEDIMSFIEAFNESDVTLEINYDVPWKGEKLLSIRYYMYYYAEGAAHPNNNYKTLNIDLENEKIIRLSDVVNIDENFAKIMSMNSKYSGPLDPSQDLEDMLKDNKLGIDAKTFLESDSHQDYYSSYTYFTENTLGFSTSVPHALGDYALFEVSYADIKDYIKNTSPIWKDFEEAFSGKPSTNEEDQSSTEDVISENAALEITEAVDFQELDNNLCGENEELVFGFPIAGSKKRLAVCIGGTSQEYITYRFGTKDKVEFEFPEEQSDSWNKFIYSYYLRGGQKENEGLDLNYLTFENDGFQYKIYQETAAESGKTEVGILVTDLATNVETKIEGIAEEAEGSLITLRENDKISIEN
ncbi:MAG: hypothetical protein H6Q59_2927 [Firmicutes bacterium]|nr:hypothetical protein [Bacillota bacterium]